MNVNLYKTCPRYFVPPSVNFLIQVSVERELFDLYKKCYTDWLEKLLVGF